MSSSSSEVLLTLSPPRATITLNRPTRGNSLSPQLQSLFESYLDRIDSNPLIHYLVLTGNGKFFCTGMDLGSGGGATEGGDKDQIFNRAKGFFQKVEMFRKPSKSYRRIVYICSEGGFQRESSGSLNMR